MNILITGAKGFIGSHLASYLEQKGQYRLFTPSSKELNLQDEVAVDNYIDTKKIDLIIHCANKGGTRDSLLMDDIVHNNLRMFFNIAKQASKVKKIIHLGSGAEYAKHKPIVNAKEDDALVQMPLDDYGFYKSICSRYIERSSNIINLRVFGCYGIGENYLIKFISNSIAKHIVGLPIIINQNVFFDYIYVNDIVKMIAYFIENDGEHSVYNITRGEKIDLLTLVDIINNTEDNVVPVQVLTSGLNMEYTSDNNRILEEMGGFIFTSYEQAIKDMYQHFQSNGVILNSKLLEEDKYIKQCNAIWKKD